jgi:hypothetical protein
MAGPWIKIEHSLPEKPEVMRLSELLKIREEQAVGHLIKFWRWCDQNLSPNCPLVNGTKSGIDRVAGVDNFAESMIAVGWLTVDEQGRLGIPNIEYHLSQSAKKRAEEQKKKQKQRTRPEVVPQIRGQKADTQGTSEGQTKGPDKNRIDETRLDTSIYFSEWYSLYPRKVAKGEAVKAYARALKRIGGDPAEAAAKLLEASKPRLLEIGKRDPQYQPNPATWLNGDGWQDEVKSINPTKPTGAGPGVNYDPAFEDQFMADLYTG